MTKLFLHIGSGKCGSTTIQQFLASNRRNLELRGTGTIECWNAGGSNNARNLALVGGSEIAYNHQVRTTDQLTDAQFTQIRETIKDETQKEITIKSAKGINTFVASSEFLYGMNSATKEIEIIRNMLASIFSEVRIVFYYRSQVDLIPSIWSQTVMGSAKSDLNLEEFVITIDPNSVMWNPFDYLSKWESLFGSEFIHGNTVDKQNLLNGDLLDDFCALINVDPSTVTKPPSSNISPGYTMLRLLRARNEILRLLSAANSDDVLAQRFRAIIELAEGLCQDLVPKLDEEVIIEMFGQSNKKFNDHFLASKAVKLPAP